MGTKSKFQYDNEGPTSKTVVFEDEWILKFKNSRVNDTHTVKVNNREAILQGREIQLATDFNMYVYIYVYMYICVFYFLSLFPSFISHLYFLSLCPSFLSITLGPISLNRSFISYRYFLPLFPILYFLSFISFLYFLPLFPSFIFLPSFP